MAKKERPHLYCSFCGKHNEEVHTIIAGPNVFICCECVHIATDILLERGYFITFEDATEHWVREYLEYNNQQPVVE